ncbi:MAG: DNA repair protein RecN [Christensenellaceae bacterium]|jgi:DNA repair protein RecN (Recombination protein N)|nr:DNA repair protein RecN [Christensenellaceae bacterium]
MLKHLKIKNIALIKDLTIEFSGGLNVLTGETGAGKSIIIDSLNFVLGDKANKSLMRTGAYGMSAEALFCGVTGKAKEILKEYNIPDDDDVLIVRSFSDTSQSIRLNGNTITAGMLKNITPYLVDIHGQHEHQSLLKPRFHLGIIDGLNSSKTDLLRAEVSGQYKKHKDIISQLDELGSNNQNRERMIDLLQYQINEIERFSLKQNEDETLAVERSRMLNSGKISANLTNALNEIDGNFSVVSSIKKAISAMNSVVQYDETLQPLINRLDGARLELSDIAGELKIVTESVNFDDAAFDRIDTRLDGIKALKKKYGATVAEVFKFLENAKEELNKYQNSTALIDNLEYQKQQVYSSLYDTANKLSDIRRGIAEEFSSKVMKELGDLGMKNAKFAVMFDPKPDKNTANITANGFDNPIFMFSANLGQPMKPLSEIISGGEMSRFMLGIKNIIADIDDLQTLVFDEIDTGISGAIGFVIACKMANISKKHQVISVSHLPQIAAMADNHLFIQKQVEANETITKVFTLDKKGSQSEVARLSGGVDGSGVALEHADELMGRCAAYKNSIK